MVHILYLRPGSCQRLGLWRIKHVCYNFDYVPGLFYNIFNQQDMYMAICLKLIDPYLPFGVS